MLCHDQKKNVGVDYSKYSLCLFISFNSVLEYVGCLAGSCCDSKMWSAGLTVSLAALIS